MRPTDAVQRLLSDLLNYHTKIQMPVSLRSLPVPPHDVMFQSASSHLLSLIRALPMVLRPLQFVELGPAILEELRCVRKVYAAERGQRQRGSKR
ncbi:hypothetical protein BKA82DRAFT_1003088 [Pisolithus tinctorius]|uniref:Uncharacterized protein n=1 Tax=Pisolithus tinctorius Marx 270 TaxID=870435 RepID=A0A0C3IX51_PISTI|nr:hypothetical protein BKA82DRAFT_1003088 [Pisolithus tinctorius]KIO01388.1 hypothetical protein M404DRAFT_1003088 [Pisolithus tinctorius Marx 270]